MRSAALRFSRHSPVAALLALAALAGTPAPAEAAPARPAIWAVALPAKAAATPASLRWLRAEGVTTLVVRGRGRAALRSLAARAVAARLDVVAPAAKAPRRACARQTGVLKTCAAAAATPTAAIALARRSLVDFVVVPVRTSAQIRTLARARVARTRIVAVLPLRAGATARAAWASAVAAAAASPTLEVAVAASGAPTPALRRFLAVVPRPAARTASRAPSSPGGLAASGATPTTVTLSWQQVADASGYGVYRDGSRVVDVEATSYTVGGLACGRSYAFAVDAFSASGRSQAVSFAATTAACSGGGGGGGGGATVDLLPPTAPLGLTRGAATTTSVTVSWTQSTDNTGVAGYGRYRNGVLTGTGAGTSHLYTGLACGTAYTFGIDAYDAAGNRSSTTTASFSTLACVGGGDTQAPSVPQSQALTPAQTSVTMSWSASTDNVGVAGYRVFRDGVAVTTVSSSPYTFTGLACGTTYTFALEAYDAAGNASNRAQASGPATTTACAAPPPPPPPPPPSGATTANLWVDESGGACTRQATRGAYVDAQACGSWNAAYQAAQTGDLILVRGGSYGDQTMGPNKAAIASPGVTIQPASGETVTVRDLENGYLTGGASNISFAGPVTARTFRSDGGGNIVVDGWTVDCGGCDGVQIFHLENATNVVVRNSDISDNNNNSLIWIQGTGLTFENNTIHDAGLPVGSSAHTECMYAWNVTNLTLKRNRFYRCAVMDVFITGSSVANGGLVENNVFEKPWETTGIISNSAYAFHFRTGGNPSPDPSNWTFRHNTFVGPLSINTTENPVGPGGMTVTGNVFLAGAPCGHANTTYSHNAFVSGACGSNAITDTLANYQAGFVSTAGSPGDYRLRATSVLIDRGSAANAPSDDLDGGARSVGAPDLGADEHGN